MNSLIVLIWIAGTIQMIIAAANIFLPRKLQYRQNLNKVSPIVRQIFIIHSVYIVLIILIFSGLCFLFPYELIGSHPLGRYMCGVLAIFWLARVPIQLFYYDERLKRENPMANVFFTGAFLFLALTFSSIAALGMFK